MDNSKQYEQEIQRLTDLGADYMKSEAMHVQRTAGHLLTKTTDTLVKEYEDLRENRTLALSVRTLLMEMYYWAISRKEPEGWNRWVQTGDIEEVLRTPQEDRN